MMMNSEKNPVTPNQTATEVANPGRAQAAPDSPVATVESPAKPTEQPLEFHEQLQQLQTQIAELQNRLQQQQQQQQEVQLRHLAEQQNLQRRSSQELEKAHKFSLEGFIKGLLPVFDSFEHAVALGKQLINLPATEKLELVGKLIEGIELTSQSLKETLNKHQVTVVGEAGEPFNPAQHEAMAVVDNTEVPANHVVTVMQKGYQLHDRLLRPARVSVNRPADN